MEHYLGRRVEHDVRSFGFAAPETLPVKTKTWRRYGEVLDQNDTNSCTGNSAAQAANSVPLRTPRKFLTEADALALYTLATQLDSFEGTYPEVDNGSSGMAVAKAGVQMGLWSRYEWAFGLDHTLSSLMKGPLIVGTNWHSDMMNPDAKGFVRPTGDVIGGHEYLLSGVNVRGKYVTFTNSWSKNWGLGGRFRMGFDDFDQLLRAEGDVILLVK